jgi:hypothetical protein
MDDGDPAFKDIDCQYIISMRSRIPLMKIDKLHSLERPPYQRDKEIIIKKQEVMLSRFLSKLSSRYP